MYKSTPLASLTLLLLSLFLLSSSTFAQSCQHYGSICPQGTCCNQGWCGSGGSFCGAGCDPLGSLPNACFPKNPCFSYRDDFNSSTRLKLASDWDGSATSTEWISQFEPSYAKIDVANSQLVLWMRKDSKLNSYGRVQGFGSTVYASRWLEYGTVSAKVKAGQGLGIVSAFITRADQGQTPDEIDFEVVGKNITGIYSNYFALDMQDYTKGSLMNLGSNMHDNWHVLTIDWKPDAIRWLVDGKVQRTLLKKDTWDSSKQAYQFPTHESQISLGIWDGGQGAEGTAFWAGTPTDWSMDPNPNYQVLVDWVDIQCYYNGNSSTVFVDPIIPTKTLNPIQPTIPVSTITIDFSGASNFNYTTLFLLITLIFMIVL